MAIKHPPKPEEPTEPTEPENTSDSPPESVDEVLDRLKAAQAAPDAPPDEATDEDVLAQASAVIDEAMQQSAMERLVAERTDDLQRLQAEYANYRKRVERDRALARQQGAESVVRELMPIFDAIAQADSHEELTGGFKVVAGEFTRLSEKLGLSAFGAIGDEFDPNLHEALMQIPSPDIEPGKVAQVIQLGYRLGQTVLRPARVAVAAAPAE